MTHVRWRILLFLMALCAISHFNRVSMSVAGTESIRAQFKISEAQIGLVYLAFLLVYTLAMMPGGVLLDRWGPRRALTIMGLGSGFFGTLTGVAGFFFQSAGGLIAALICIRGLMGLVTVPLHPASAQAASHWMPPHRIGWANGLITCAAIGGVTASYPVFGWLMDRFGWPMSFVLAGVATAGLTILWAFVSADTPSDHPRVNAAELEFITAGRSGGPDPSVSPDQTLPSRVMALVRNPTILRLTFSYAAVGYFQYLFFYWIQYYFAEVLHLEKDQSRFYASGCTLGLAVGMPLGGWLSGLVPQRNRNVVPGTSLVLGAVLVAAGIVVREPLLIVGLFALAMTAVGASESSFWQTAVEAGGRQGGTAAAIMNTGGNGIGLLAPWLTPVISQHLGWHAGFLLGGAICLLGAACWWKLKHAPER